MRTILTVVAFCHIAKMVEEMVAVMRPHVVLSKANRMGVHPLSKRAGRMAQAIANIVEKCHCGESVAGCAVHTDHCTNGRMGYFYPVCERHKGWEFAKYEGVSIYL